mgnify:CR=1 FL=1
MNFLFRKDMRIICQGFTGNSGTYHAKLSINYGTCIVGGVTPGKGGYTHLGLPVFNTVAEAVKSTNANTSIIFVPALYCKDSILEAIDAGIKFIICITEGIPILDMLHIKSIIKKYNVVFIGPNSPGFVIPNNSRLGIMPCDIHKPGVVGIISRSGTLTYEAIHQTTITGLGQSLSVGIGGDPIIGIDFINMLSFFEQDPYTKIILIIGEIGGLAEENAAKFITDNVSKPVLAYISGINAPANKRMGHAGAIISKGKGGAENKIKMLNDSGVCVIKSLPDIGEVLLSKYKSFYNII